MGTIRKGPFTQADGEVEIDLGFEINYEWHELTIAVFDAQGDPATSGVTGTVAASVRKRGADRTEAFDQTVNLATDERSWAPELSQAEIFLVTPTGLNAGFSYYVTVNSWGIA